MMNDAHVEQLFMLLFLPSSFLILKILFYFVVVRSSQIFLLAHFFTFSKKNYETPHNIDNDHDLLDIEPHFINTPINAEITADAFIKYRGKQFPYPAQNRNWSIIFSIIRFPLVFEHGDNIS
jgi:hypothetical protein